MMNRFSQTLHGQRNKNNPSEENEQPADSEPQSEGLSAEELAERPYDEGMPGTRARTHSSGHSV